MCWYGFTCSARRCGALRDAHAVAHAAAAAEAMKRRAEVHRRILFRGAAVGYTVENNAASTLLVLAEGGTPLTGTPGTPGTRPGCASLNEKWLLGNKFMFKL